MESDRPNTAPPAQPNGPEGAPGTAPESAERARLHYRRGNRLFEQKAWDQALREWRQAWHIWGPAGAVSAAVARSLVSLRAVLFLLATVLAVYYLIFALFPRDPFDLLSAQGSPSQERSWWEQFLDTGRPGGGGDAHKMGVREWWQRLRDRSAWGRDDEVAQGQRFRPTIDERWAELLRRYGRWGPLTFTELDLKVVSGYGLTTLGDYEGAIAISKEALKTASGDEKLGELWQVLATAYYFQGYRHQPDRLATYDLSYMRLSAAAYEQAIRFRPQTISFGNLGWTYYLLGEFRLAEQYSLRALSFDETLDYVRLNLGLIYMVQGKLRDSFGYYRKVAVRLPNDEVYLGGITDLKEVLRDHPGRHTFAHFMIGYLSLQRGDLPEARRNLQAYVASPGAHPDWLSLARRWLADPASAVEG